MYNCGYTDNLTIWKYIECNQGPQTQPLGIAISVTIINVVLFITGLTGNILVCIVTIKHPSLNTPTDYFLVNLALSDLILLIFGLPYDVSLYWNLYPTILGEFCCQARALIAEMSSYVSVLTIVAFSTERYLAICHPLQKFAMSNLQRSLRVILIIWILSFICALPIAFESDIHLLIFPPTNKSIPESAICGMMVQSEGIPLTEVSSTVFFFIPMIIIAYQYIKMGIAIFGVTHKERNIGRGMGSVHGRKSKLQNKNIIKMLALVVLGFFACWCPFHFQRVSSVYLYDNQFYMELNHWIYFISGIFYYFSSTLNPILYNVMSDRMRNAFREVLCGVKTRQISRINSSCRDTAVLEISRPVSVKDDELYLFANNDKHNSQ